MKAWQLITHPTASLTYHKAGIKVPPGAEEHYGFFKPTDEVHQAWEETNRFVQALKAEDILFQCQPSFKETSENITNMRKFFNSAKDTGYLLVWEPRDGWSEPTIKAMCSELGLVHCVDYIHRA